MLWIICMIRYHFPLILDMWALFFWKHCKILHIIFNGKHIFSFVKHHVHFGASRSAYREEGGKSWDRNASSKILKSSDKTRTWKIWKKSTLSNSCYILWRMLKIQIFLFLCPLFISSPFFLVSLHLPKYFILPFKSVIIFLSKQIQKEKKELVPAWGQWELRHWL